jgi:hypothetical protein
MSKYRRLKSKHRCSANIDVYRPSLARTHSEKVSELEREDPQVEAKKEIKAKEWTRK